MKRSSTTALILSCLGLLPACGGGASSRPTPSGPPGAPPNLFLKGAISVPSAGVVVLNGVTVTTPATVRIEGVASPASELKAGMVVRVKARAGAAGRHGEGVEVEFEDAVKGKVEARGADTLTVGGQTVRVDDATEFEDNAARLGSVAPGDRVRVSGVPDDRGGLRATRVDRLAGASEDFELKGYVSGLTATGFTLEISPDAGPADTYTVNLLGGATLPAGLVDGAFVEVRSSRGVQPGQVIEAAAIVIEDDAPGDAGGETELEGIVTSGAAASFVLAGTTVITGAGTTWTGGLPGDLLPGAKVEAEGTLGADGVLAAAKVSFKASSLVQGAVTALAVDAAGLGTLTVNGVTVGVGTLTEQRDAAAGLAAGDLVEVRGAPGRDGTTLVATRLQRSGDARPILAGLVTARDELAATLTILGKTVALGAVEPGGLHGLSSGAGGDGAALATADFLAAVTPGLTVVKARGKDAASFVDPVLTAREAELEGDR